MLTYPPFVGKCRASVFHLSGHALISPLRAGLVLAEPIQIAPSSPLSAPDLFATKSTICNSISFIHQAVAKTVTPERNLVVRKRQSLGQGLLYSSVPPSFPVEWNVDSSKPQNHDAVLLTAWMAGNRVGQKSHACAQTRVDFAASVFCPSVNYWAALDGRKEIGFVGEKRLELAQLSLLA